MQIQTHLQTCCGAAPPLHDTLPAHGPVIGGVIAAGALLVQLVPSALCPSWELIRLVTALA